MHSSVVTFVNGSESTAVLTSVNVLVINEEGRTRDRSCGFLQKLCSHGASVFFVLVISASVIKNKTRPHTHIFVRH